MKKNKSGKSSAGATGSKTKMESQHESKSVVTQKSNSGESFKDVWIEDQSSCKLCHGTTRVTKMLECNRCHEHFCIKCLNIGDKAYDILSKSDMMWFCPPCRITVEKSILTDRKIEERCKEIMRTYESRIAELERIISLKCEQSDIRKIVQEEVEMQAKTGGKTVSAASTEQIISELKERKQRENNLMIFGIPEQQKGSGNQRKEKDIKMIGDLFEECELTDDETPRNVIRVEKRPEADSIMGASPIKCCLLKV